MATSTSTEPVRRTPWSQHCLLHLVFLLMGAELFLLSPLLTEIGTDLRASPAATGWVLTAYVLAYAVSTPVLAALSPGRSPRRVIMAGVVVFGLGELGCATAPSLPALIGAHAISGLGGALAAPAVWAYLGETAAPAERGRAVTRGAAVYAAGQIVGVPLGSLVADRFGWRWTFVVIACGLAISLILILLRLRDPHTRDPNPRRPLNQGHRADPHTSSSHARQLLRSEAVLWRCHGFAPLLAVTALTQAARLGSYTYLGVYLGQRFGLGTVGLGLLGALVGAGSMSGSLAAGPLMDRLRRSGRPIPLLIVAWSLLLAVGLATAFATGRLWLAVLMVLLWSAGGGAVYSTAQAHLTDTLPDRRASAASWNNAAMNGGAAAGTALLGGLSPGDGAFVAIAVALACAAAVISASQIRG